MPDIVAVGALNLDYIGPQSSFLYGDRPVVLEQFERNTETEVDLAQVEECLADRHASLLIPSLGGSAFNVTMALANLRASVSQAYVGADGATGVAGLSFTAALQAVGVGTSNVFLSEERSGVCISYPEDGERTLLTYPGANVGLGEHLRANRGAVLDQLASSQVVHLTSLFDPDSPLVVADLVAEAKRRNPWLRVVFDPGYAWCRTRPEGFLRLLPLADYLLVNATEFKLIGRRRPIEDDTTIAGRILDGLERQSVVIAVKRYDRIDIYYRVHAKVRQLRFRNMPLLPHQIEDATGAGDVFAAGLMVGLVYPALGLEHGVELGLKLVHEKLRHVGTNSAAAYAQVFSQFLASLDSREIDVFAVGAANRPADDPRPRRSRICRSGHRSFSAGRFCNQCARPFVDSCPRCRQAIATAEDDADTAILSLFCDACGAPMPWTDVEAVLGAAASQLVDHGEVSDAERDEILSVMSELSAELEAGSTEIEAVAASGRLGSWGPKVETFLIDFMAGIATNMIG